MLKTTNLKSLMNSKLKLLPLMLKMLLQKSKNFMKKLIVSTMAMVIPSIAKGVEELVKHLLPTSANLKKS